MQVGKLAKILIGSATVALFFTLLGIGLAASGAIDMALARVFFLLAWLVAVVGTAVSDLVCSKPWKHVVGITLIPVVLIGGILLYLDHWVVQHKAEQDALNQPSPKMTTTASGPNVPIVKTIMPKRPKPDKPTVQQSSTGSNSPNTSVGTINQSGQGNVSQVGNGSAQSCPNGICIGGENSGNATVNNFGPLLPKVSWSVEDKPALKDAKHPEVWIKISINRTLLDPKFAIRCARPCKAVG